MRIVVDLTELRPGGETGGVKHFLLAYLKRLRRHLPANATYALLTNSATHTEVLRELAGLGDELVCIRPLADVAPPAGSAYAPKERVAIPPPADLADLVQGDVFYAPFGTVRNASPGIPVLTFIVDILHRDYPSTLNAAEIAHREADFRAVVARSALFQCNSVHVIERLHSLYGVAKSRAFRVYNVVHDRLPRNPVHPPPAGLPAGPFFFYPANAWLHKNHDTLLVAYRSYRARRPDTAWPLVLTGHASARMQELLLTASALGLGDSVQFLGYLPDADLAAVWSRAGALVLPSLHEGFGIPLLEAMSFGVPIAASRVCSIPEIAGDAALLFDPTRPVEIAEVLASISEDASLRAGLVAAGNVRLRELERDDHSSELARRLIEAAGWWPPACVAGAAVDGWISDAVVFGLPETARSGGTLRLAVLDASPRAQFCVRAGTVPHGSFALRDLVGGALDIRVHPNTRSVTIRILNGENLNPLDPRIHAARFRSATFQPADERLAPYDFGMMT